MKCKDCQKPLQGGFEQEKDIFLCAKCVIFKLNKESILNTLQYAANILNHELRPGNRITKRKMRDIKYYLEISVNNTKELNTRENNV